MKNKKKLIIWGATGQSVVLEEFLSKDYSIELLLDNNQKIKMLQIALQYTLPRLQAMMIKEEQKEDEPIFIEVYERDKNKNEEVWKDNFNVTSTHTIKRKP